MPAGDRHLLCVPFGVKRPPCLEIALGAHADVLHIVFQIDGDLLALKDELPIDPAAVAGGLAPAGADRGMFPETSRKAPRPAPLSAS